MDGVNKKCFVCRREAKSMKVLLSSRFVCEECLTVMNKNETLCCLDCDAVRKIPPDNTERELSCLYEGVNTSNSTDRPCLQEGIRDRCRFDVTAQIKDRRETRHDHRRYYSGKHVASEPNLSYLFHPGNVGNSSLKTKIQDLTGQVKKPTGVCEKHDMEETKFYCQTCKMDICRDCALLDHRDHDYVYYSERGDTKDSLHERLSKLLKYAEEKQAVLNEKLEYLDSRLEKKSKEVEEAKVEIRSRTSRLKALISEQEEILLSCLEGHIKSVSRNVKSQKTALESALDDVNYGLEIAQEMFRNNSSKMPRKLPNGLTKNHAAPDQNETGPVRTNDGKCSAVTIVADDHENCHDKVSRRQFESEGDFCDDKFDADDLYIVEKEKLDSSISSGCPWNSDMKKLNNTLIIAKNNIKEPLPKNSTFDFVLSFGDQGSHSGEFEEPVGVTVSPDGTIFIADYTNDRLQLYDRNGHFLRAMSQVTTETGRKVPFLCPTGLATDKSGNIVIAERGRHRITVVAPDGRLQHKFGRLGKAQGQLRDPHGVSVDKRGRIIVSDTTNNRIQVFDKDGDVIFAFGNKGEHVLDYPNYAIFHKGVFIVSDTDNDCVKIFDKEGQFLRTLGVTENEEGSFSAPSGLAVYKEDYILVCDFNNDCVKMFSLEGVFVTKIGCEGTGPGEFSGPEAVTVTSEDKIIVTDKNNSRVQVFELRQ